MKKNKMNLVFPEVSESIPVAIMSDSVEDAQGKVLAGEGTKFHTEFGCLNGCQETVSHVYIETIRVSESEMTSIYTHIFAKVGRENNISNRVRFPDGMEMDIVACSGDPGWTEAILFRNGGECGCSDVEEKYEGVWSLCCDGVMYITVVVPEVSKWITADIIVLPGSCLNSAAQVIAHQTNCKGVMGAGLALAIRESYPEIMLEYQEACQSKHMLGECQLIATQDDRYIANLFGQDAFGSGRQTDYNALQSALNSLVDLMQARGLSSVSMPYNLGCGLAGGDWDVVFEMLKKTFTGKNIRLELWQLP